MAIFKSQIFTQASGSVGGLTFSHNRGGMYTRARSIPTNPGTTFQEAVRAIVSQLSVAWFQALTEAQREAWENYATVTPIVSKVGDPLTLSGHQMYIRSNTPRVQAGFTRLDAGPAVQGIPDFTAPSFAGDATADEIDVTFTDTDAWANEDAAAMVVYASRPQKATINYFKGPYRLAGTIDGNATTAPTSPAAISLPFAVNAGDRLFALVRITRADGRLSYPFRGFATAA